MSELRRELTRLYMEIGGLLNTVEDNDEREALQQHGETVLNDELFAGRENRRLVAPLHAQLNRLGFRPVENVVALDRHSMKVQP